MATPVDNYDIKINEGATKDIPRSKDIRKKNHNCKWGMFMVFGATLVAIVVFLGIWLGYVEKHDCTEKDMGNKKAVVQTTPVMTTKTPTPCSTWDPGSKPNNIDVLILGAGMSGIMAAKTLHDKGCGNFRIIEGTNRIGGRVKETTFSGKVVELGANWIHHIYSNPIWKIKQNLNLTGVKDNYDDYTYRWNGTIATEQADLYWEKLDKAEYTIIKLAEEKLNHSGPDTSQRVGLMLGGWRPKTALENAVEYYDFDFEFADIPKATSLKYNYKAFEDLKHEEATNFFVSDQRGYISILQEIADTFLIRNDSRLVLNEIIRAVNYSSSGVAVTTECSGRYPCNVYRSKYALMTFSVGVLQSDLINFSPPLPEWKLERIFEFKMTKFVKIFLKVPDVSRLDSSHYILYAHKTRRGYYTVWMNFEAEKYFNDGSNILLVVVTGQEASRVIQLEKSQVKQELTAALRDMYGPSFPAPSDLMMSSWETDPLFMGAFSNWPIGINGETFKGMSAPIDNLYFGGEATDTSNGFLDSAYRSGIDTAGKIHRCMVHGNCEKYIPRHVQQQQCHTDLHKEEPLSSQIRHICPSIDRHLHPER